jgi:hypothetical protein
MKNKILIMLLGWFGVVGYCAASPVVTGPDLRNTKTAAVETGEKGTVVVFLSAECPCSNSHVGELRQLAQEHPEFHFVGVHSNGDEAESESRAYFTKVGLPFPAVQDADAKIADRFKAFKTPHAFVLRPDGEVVYRGGVTDSKDCVKSDRKYLREALDDVTHGRPVRTPETRTLGCAISRHHG